MDLPLAPVGARGAVAFMAEALRAAGDGEVTLVAVGPFTNVALLAREHPDLMAKAGDIVVMGGASTAGGNVTPAAEFNVHADPHAAAAVFACGRPVVVHGLDVTHQVLAAPRHAERLAREGGEAGRRLAPLLAPAAGSRGPRFGDDRSPIHDPCAIAWLLDPGLFRSELVPAAVETDGTHTFGETVVDWWGVTGADAERPVGDRGRRRGGPRPPHRAGRAPLIRHRPQSPGQPHPPLTPTPLPAGEGLCALPPWCGGPLPPLSPLSPRERGRG